MVKQTHFLVYKITNLINHKIYIGIHITKNINDEYMGSSKYLNKSIKKHGIENFKKEILFDFDNPEEMIAKEKELVNEEFVKSDETYNLNIGGGSFYFINVNKLNNTGNQQITIRDKLKSDLNFKQDFSNKITTRLKTYYLTHQGTFTGKTHREESKKLIGQKNSIHQQGSGNSQYGTCWIYNLELKENKKIKKIEVDLWLKLGWRLGRKMKF